MLFDTDTYFEQMQDLRRIQPLKPPNNKVPAVNLSKLSFDKKIAPILDVRICNKFIIRDKFDWDLMEPRLRPQDFAAALCSQLPVFKTDEEKQQTIEKMTQSILDQIQAHIDKNTFFPRVRFCRKDEEIISNDQVCVNCDSILTNSEFCNHCGLQYEKKPGPQAAPGTQVPASVTAKENQLSMQESFKKNASIDSKSTLSKKQSEIPNEDSKEVAKNDNQDFKIPDPIEITNIRSMNHQSMALRSIDGEQQITWKDRITGDYAFSGKEKKICKKCNEVNPRGINSSLNSDNYTLYFWDMLHSEPLFSSLNKINDYLSESDFISVRDLYKKVKEILTQPNTERLFDITDTQLLELHDSIDEKFEWLLTDNELTERIFNDATSQKTARKRTRQMHYNFKDAQRIHDTKLSGRDNNFEEDYESAYKRQNTGYEANSRFKHRPHNFESTKMQAIIQNYNLLSQMGFLDQKVMQSEPINKLVNEKEEVIQSLIKKRGRPKKFDLTYEDMLNVDKWDDSKLVFQTGLVGLQGAQEEDNENGGTGNGKKTYDGNADVCGICLNPGKLICCDDCPSAFHSECLGYEKQCPRGKWKCYFCKVTKYGLRMVPRMAPSERPVCDELADNTPTWEDKAIQMLDILRDYYCLGMFFDDSKLSQEQKDQLIKKKLAEVGENQEVKVKSVQQLFNEVVDNEAQETYKNHEEFYNELKRILNIYAKGLDKKDLLSMCAKAALILIEKLVEENEIFNYIKPNKKIRPMRVQQQKPQSSIPAVGVALTRSRRELRNSKQEQGNNYKEDESNNEDYQQMSDQQEPEQSKQSSESDFEVQIDEDDSMRKTPIKTRTQQNQKQDVIQNQSKNSKTQTPKKPQISDIQANNTPIRMTRNRLKSLGSNN
ncbi:dna binding and zinc-finger domain-containing protein [Stylonychia lemnae]|uniref:Dna binding and zinc-finger domain-containing protein n=1 Tax=Stylonychia lemnae TaxID=5949 RepID=A0A078ACF2_STYLE|nr:dna binding and zinc-finger domain-containing protein [Stylonychia lemnae]|eukprot:CDW79536.1 dna binding and zinc-finger domain-containing protein [Stylonychia lemnae]